MMLQLNPPIPVWLPDLNQSGFALAWIDYSQEHDTLWMIGTQAGMILTLPQSKIRLVENLSLERSAQAPIVSNLAEQFAQLNLNLPYNPLAGKK